MHEDYLQRIWSQSRIPSPQLQLIDGTPIVVKNPGKHNTAHSGPDFKEACVQFDNLEFHGAIEIHVNGSDWYKHKHHQDEAYNGVVLHVVYNNDLQIVQNGFSLPTLELKDFIDLDHFQKSFDMSPLEPDRPCKNSLDSVDSIYWSSMKTKSLIQKLNKKTAGLNQLNEEEAMYRLVASVFGMGINKKAFLELAENLTWKSLQQLDARKRKQLILATSGCAQGDFSKKLENEHQWHFKGTRPSNFPSVRIPQFAQFIAYINIERFIEAVSSDLVLVNFDKYLKTISVSLGKPILSKSLRIHMLVNAIAPYLYWKAESTKNEHYLELALDLLGELPREKNAITRGWENNWIHAKNAFDSQGLIALNRYYCSLKKCLSCEVGLKVLNRLE